MSAKSHSGSPPNQELIQATHIALEEGKELLEWWRKHSRSAKTFPLLTGDHRLVEMTGFFDESTFQRGRRSVMGCLQKARFEVKPTDKNEAGDLLRYFVRNCFFADCLWKRSQGLRGGFEYRPLLQKEKGSGTIKPVKAESDHATNLGALRSQVEWLVARVDIHDFFRSFPGLRLAATSLSKILRESAFVVFHDAFSLPAEDDSEETLAATSFGYSFLPLPVHRSPFGFGPGRFESAVKQFRFLLKRGGFLEIQLSFLVSPRSQRIFNFWKNEPFYGLARLLDRLTFEKLHLRRRAQDWVDSALLRVHGKVHHDLLLGMAGVWPSRFGRREGDDS